jgi:beige protein homolog 1
MCSSNPDHIIHGVKILARLLVTQGPVYVSKFSSRAHGFPILRHNLAPWWEMTPIWPTLLAVLFGVDVISLKSFPLDQPLRLFDLITLVKLGDEEPTVVFPEIFPIISALLKAGFDATLRAANNARILEEGEMTLSPDSPIARPGSSGDGISPIPKDHTRSAATLQVVVQFLLDMHAASSSFREFASSPQVMENLLGILFPIVCSADPVNPETELMSKDSILTFDTGEIRIESLTLHHAPAPILRPASSLSVRSIEEDEGRISFDQPGRPRASSLRRASSYVLVASNAGAHNGSKATINPAVGTKTMRRQAPALNVSNSTVGSLLELVTAISVDSVLGKRDFTNFDFSTKLPPGFQEHQIYFVTYLFRNILSHLDNALSIDRTALYQSNRTLCNVIRFSQKCSDAVFEGGAFRSALTLGWFLSGAGPLWEFVGRILDFLDSPEVAKQKFVKSSESNVTVLRKVFNRLVLFQLSEIEDVNAVEELTIALLDRILFWQKVLFSSTNQDMEFIRMFCYHLYVFLFDTRRRVRLVASNACPIYI